MRRIDPRLLLIAGAAFISVSAIFVRLSGVSSGTAALFRCALALPLLLPLAARERRRAGPRRRQGVDVAAGLLLGVDLVLWGASIGEVGAGIATVLVNVQVVVVPLLALAAFGERPSRAFAMAVPVMLGGVALAGGLADSGTHAVHGADPVRGVLYGTGAGLAYGGYLFLTRLAGDGQTHRARPVLLATLGAGAASVVVGAPWQGVDLTPGWAALGWLAALAVTGQVCGWMLIGAALPRLRAEVGGTLLLLQPVLAVIFGAVVLAEYPALLQIAGCLLVVAALWLTTRSAAGPPAAEPGAAAPEPGASSRNHRAAESVRGHEAATGPARR
ncbi:DMT family transporter [Actinomadura rubrisoli]|uniref:EamA family transporter n=1 Tax=Actinomadura rubrisoli TaxID=2530368 RepID=A0A4R5BRY8_9ACTN|nr:DMT family transporter [Actinomadura rubrisoli]TDD88030.1 EamA family transporter [Actinomadura rubrisoli]